MTEENDFSWEMIKLALSSVAKTAIIPMQDILGLGSSARMNTPATQVNFKCIKEQCRALDRSLVVQLRLPKNFMGKFNLRKQVHSMKQLVLDKFLRNRDDVTDYLSTNVHGSCCNYDFSFSTITGRKLELEDTSNCEVRFPGE